MYLVEAEIEEALDMLAVSIEAGRDEDAPFEVFRANQFGESSEVFRRADILFGGFDAAIGPFLHTLLGRFLGGCCPGDVELQGFPHRGGEPAGAASALPDCFWEHPQLRGGRRARESSSPPPSPRL